MLVITLLARSSAFPVRDKINLMDLKDFVEANKMNFALQFCFLPSGDNMLSELSVNFINQVTATDFYPISGTGKQLEKSLHAVIVVFQSILGIGRI